MYNICEDVYLLFIDLKSLYPSIKSKWTFYFKYTDKNILPNKIYFLPIEPNPYWNESLGGQQTIF